MKGLITAIIGCGDFVYDNIVKFIWYNADCL